MSNPDNALGTNGAYGGRTSVNAFNDVLASFKSRGVLSGWGCEPSIGLTVTLGGNGTERDVAIAEDNAGNKTTVNNISQLPVPVTLPAAPASNSRIDAIVAYIEGSPSSDGETDNYSAVNLLVVSGTASTSPTEPTDGDIRAAITADGASGVTAYYVVLANISVPSGTTDIDATMIVAGATAGIGSRNIDFATFTESGIIRMGDYKIEWGSTPITVTGGVDATKAITFPERFGSVPIVIPSIQFWTGPNGVWVSSITELDCMLGTRFGNEGSTYDTSMSWIAIGRN